MYTGEGVFGHGPRDFNLGTFANCSSGVGIDIVVIFNNVFQANLFLFVLHRTDDY